MKSFGLFLLLFFHVTQADVLFWEQDEWAATAVPKQRLHLKTAFNWYIHRHAASWWPQIHFGVSGAESQSRSAWVPDKAAHRSRLLQDGQQTESLHVPHPQALRHVIILCSKEAVISTESQSRDADFRVGSVWIGLDYWHLGWQLCDLIWNKASLVSLHHLNVFHHPFLDLSLFLFYLFIKHFHTTTGLIQMLYNTKKNLNHKTQYNWHG